MTPDRAAASRNLNPGDVNPGNMNPDNIDPGFAGPAVATGMAAAPVWQVERPRLDAALHRLRAGEVRSLGLWAAAGSGKTTLMSSWALRLRRAGESVAWLSGVELDSLNPDLVWAQADRVARPLPAGKRPVRYVFIDDLHRLIGTDPAGTLGDLVASAPDGLRLVIAARYRPFAGLAYLRAAGSMIDLEQADLRFDLREVRQLATQHGLTMSDAEANGLLRRTGGWVTGLALAMPRRPGGPDPAAGVLRLEGGDDGALADYLRSEVIAGLAAEETTVISVAAIRDLVPLELAVAVTGRPDAGAVLDRLARRNVLIAREGTDAYRYHPVLLSFLQADALRGNPAAAAAGHRTAARWYARRGDGVNALEQALASRSADIIVDMLDEFGLDLVLAGDPGAVRRAVAAVRGSEPSLALLAVRLLLEAPYFPDRGRARFLIAAAGRMGGLTGTRAPTWALVVAALTVIFAAEEGELTGGLAGIEAARRHPSRQADLAADLLAATAEAWCLGRRGEWAESEDTLREVAVTARGAGYAWLFLLASDLAATSAARRGDWVRARMIEDQMAAATDAEVGPEDDAPVDRATARALLSALIRRYEGCQPIEPGLLRQVLAADPLGTDTGLVVPAQALMLLADLASDPKPRPAVERLARLMRETGVDHPRVLSICCIPLFDLANALDGRTAAREITRLVEAALGRDSLEALLLRFLANPPAQARLDAEARLEAATTATGRAWRGTTVVCAWIALAHFAENSGRHVEADARLVRALRLTEQLRVERAFLAFGGQGVSLLETRIGRLGELDGLARGILRCAGQAHPDTPPTLANVLTERERELLRELPFHQSVAEIARKHNVSANTVKTHLRNIYRKLGAADRARAVVIARDGGLL